MGNRNKSKKPHTEDEIVDGAAVDDILNMSIRDFLKIPHENTGLFSITLPPGIIGEEPAIIVAALGRSTLELIEAMVDARLIDPTIFGKAVEQGKNPFRA